MIKQTPTGNYPGSFYCQTESKFFGTGFAVLMMIADTEEKSCAMLNRASIRNGTKCIYYPATDIEYREYREKFA